MAELQIEIKDLYLETNKHPLFWGKNINLVLLSGKINVLYGPNGIGKTVLLEYLAKRRNPDIIRGQVTNSGFTGPEQIAYLPQRLEDIDDISIEEMLNIALQKMERNRVRLLFGEMIMNWKKEKCFSNYSGGELRMMIFLLVTLQNQLVHFYDEPFQNIDPNGTRIINNSLSILANSGKLVGVVTNDIKEISIDSKLVQFIQFSEMV